MKKNQALSFIERAKERQSSWVGSELDRAVCHVIYVPTSLSPPPYSKHDFERRERAGAKATLHSFPLFPLLPSLPPDKLCVPLKWR